MDSKRFDNLARSFAETTDRRAALRFILGAVAAWLGMLAGRFTARAATPAMTLSPTSGKIKTAVTATITGFRSSETITLLWFDGSTSKSIAAGLTNSNGAATISFTTPYAFRGYHVVRAKGNKGSVADSRFAIVPSFTLKPKKGPAGTATKASLSGFAKGVTIDVYFYSTADRSGSATKLTSTVVSGTGTGAAYFNVPSGATLGIHRIEGRERVSGRLASAKFVVACTSASQCPGADSECAHRTCVNGYCGMAKEPAGTPIANQTAGDCQTDVCDGNGGVTSQPDNSDVPDDGNECTVGICVDGVPGSSPSTAGTPCSTGECDGFGTCVPPAEGACAPGAPTFSEPCYEGPPGTAGMGICQAGMRTCQDGVWGACVGQVLPSPEICNGLDDDCDGVVDDGFPVGEPCDNGHLGICHQTGTYVCSQDGSQVICDAPVVSPQPETCNGLDDDCDGLVDEGAICPDVANGTSACVQAVCMTVACNSGFANCNGNQADGCETNLMTNPLHCGGCGQVCSGSCVNGVCCQSQAQACAGKNCGIVTNNCGQQFSCGICSAPSTCGGGGTANLCGCTPATCDQLGKSCGSFSDGCGGSVDCGSCDTGEICNPNGFCQPL